MVLNLGASLFRPWTRVGGLVLGNLCAVSKLCRSLCAPAWAASPQLLSALHAGGEKDVEKSGSHRPPESTLCPRSAKFGVSSEDTRCRAGESAFCAEVQVFDLFSSWHARTHSGIQRVCKHSPELRKAFVL